MFGAEEDDVLSTTLIPLGEQLFGVDIVENVFPNPCATAETDVTNTIMIMLLTLEPSFVFANQTALVTKLATCSPSQPHLRCEALKAMLWILPDAK